MAVIVIELVSFANGAVGVDDDPNGSVDLDFDARAVFLRLIASINQADIATTDGWTNSNAIIRMTIN